VVGEVGGDADDDDDGGVGSVVVAEFLGGGDEFGQRLSRRVVGSAIGFSAVQGSPCRFVKARRARELSAELHPGLSLVAYTALSYIEARPDTRSADIAADWGLDKSTLSRQINQLVAADLLVRTGERPGRRGQQLELTPSGRHALDAAAESIRARLIGALQTWTDHDVRTFTKLMIRFNGLQD
jgi:DNA-binding MarR family transcriptional regulator